MKFLILCFLFSLTALAAIETLNFKIIPGKFHQGGKASAFLLSTDDVKNVMLVKLDYEVYKKAMVPVPSEYLKGSVEQELPLIFIDERGFLKLEVDKKMDLPDATLVHMGRVKLGALDNAHQVRIIAKNGRSEIDVYFHPHLPELGWGKVRILLHTPIPLLRDYSLEALLVQ